MTDQVADIDVSYINSVRDTAVALVLQANEAHRRGAEGLAVTLTDAAGSVAMWANALEEAWNVR